MDPKKRRWIYAGLALVAGVGLVSAVSASGPEAPAKPKPRRLGPGARLLLVGDSLAGGLATPLRRLALEAHVPFLADGRDSTRIDQWASKPWLDEALKASSPTVVLVSLGTNDMRAPNIAARRSMVLQIVELIKSFGAETLWIMPPTMPFPDIGIRQMLLTVGVPVFRSDMLTIARGKDGIHPTAAANAGWSGVIWNWADNRF